MRKKSKKIIIKGTLMKAKKGFGFVVPEEPAHIYAAVFPRRRRAGL